MFQVGFGWGAHASRDPHSATHVRSRVMSPTYTLGARRYSLTFDEEPPSDGSTRLARMIRNGFVENVEIQKVWPTSEPGSSWKKASVQTVPYPFDECPSELKDLAVYATNINDRTPGTRVLFAVPTFGPEEVDDGKPSKNRKQKMAINTALLCIRGVTGVQTYTENGWILPPTEEDLDNCSYIIIVQNQ